LLPPETSVAFGTLLGRFAEDDHLVQVFLTSLERRFGVRLHYFEAVAAGHLVDLAGLIAERAPARSVAR
jgi:hypothetical protein